MKKETIYESIFWVLLDKTICQILNIIINLIFLFYLSPSDFGAIAAILAIVGFLNIVRDFALQDSIIKNVTSKKNLNQLNGIIVIISLLSFFVYLAIALVTPRLFGESSYFRLTLLLYIPFIFQGFSTVSKVILQKRKNFKTLFCINISAIVISASVGLGLAVYGFGLMSLIAKMAIFEIVVFVGTALFSKIKLIFDFDLSAVKQHFAFSRPLVKSNLINYIARNIDDILIGNQIGPAMLGLYNRSYNFTLYIVPSFFQYFNTVIFVHLSDHEHRIDELRIIYNKLISFIGLVVFIIAFSIFRFSKPLVEYYLSQEWHDMVPLIKIFCIVLVIHAFSFINGEIFKILNETRVYFRLTALTKTITIILIVVSVFSSHSIVWVAISYTMGVSISALLFWYKITNMLKLKFNIYFLLNLKSLVAIAISVILYMGCLLIVDSEILGFTILILSYTLFQLLLNKKLLGEAKTIFTNVFDIT